MARYVNLDYAASSPALAVVASHVNTVLPLYASVHRGAGYASQVSTSAYEYARSVIGDFVGARPGDHVIFTRNTTDALNLLAGVVPGETVLLDIEHHANLLPWTRASGRIVVAGATVAETLGRIETELAARPAALLTVTGASNVTGETLPLRRLATIAHRYGTRLAVDGAQLVPHRRIDLAADGVDYLAFSGHKTYAPFGAGVLVGRGDWLDAGEPYLLGGGAVRSVSLSEATWRSGAARHEAGSPNVLGATALARSVQELALLDEQAWHSHEAALRAQLVHGLEGLPGVRLLQIFPDSVEPVGVVSFTVEGVDSRLLAIYLSAEWGIGVRDGKFCAHPLLARLGISEPALRASVGVGSSAADVTALVSAIEKFLRDGPAWTYDLVDGQWAAVDDTRPRPAWAPALPSGGDPQSCGG
jgi:selenocysteine lyase/cysteine desulfurase